MADTRTLRQARTAYFQANGFGETGGYDDAWVDFSLGPVPFPFPNTPARLRAIRYHDLHHVLTGYATSTVGEFEISAWEIAAGCKGFAAAWILNLGGTFAGLLVAPQKTAAAFARGLGDRSLYGEDFDPLIEMTVDDARAKYLAATPRTRLGLLGTLQLALAAAAGLAIGLVLFALLLPLAPVGIVTNVLRRRAAA
jgi:hypothetical protein